MSTPTVSMPTVKTANTPALRSNMTAGSVSVPTIVPLRLPIGNKLEIDTRTLIELRSGTIQRTEARVLCMNFHGFCRHAWR